MGITFKGNKLPPGKVMEVTLFGKEVRIRDRTPEEKKFDNLLNEIGELNINDEWWLDRRLERSIIYNRFQGKLEPTQIDQYLDSFKSIFDNDWWSPRSSAPGCFVRRDPLGFFSAQDTVGFIVRIGECVTTLGGKKALGYELIKKLQNRNTFKSASNEIDIAACFTQAGFTLNMYPTVPSGRKPEGKLLIDGKEIYYEATEQHFSEYHIASIKVETRILDWINKNIGLVDGHIKFLLNQNNPEDLATELIRFLEKELEKETFNQLPYCYKNNKFEIYICKDTIDGSWFGVEGLEPDFGYMVEQWIKKLFKKAKQLPAKECGVLIGGPLFLWDPDDVNVAIDALSKELQGGHTRVSGIILCARHVGYSGLIRHVPRIIINPRVKITNEDEIERMATALFTYPTW